MKKILQNLLILTIILNIFSTTDIIAQEWEDYLPKSKSEYTLFDYQKAFRSYEKANNIKNGYIVNDRGEKTKVPGWKIFKRWEYEQEKRVNQKTGEFPKTSAADEYQKWLVKNPQTTGSSRGNWTSTAPPSGTLTNHRGRLNCIAFHPSDNNTYWVGSPSGGIWKTTDDGGSWIVLNDNEAVLGVSDIAVSSNYVSDNTIYIATGDKDGGSLSQLGGMQVNDNNSIGVLKSTDGGATWSATGLSFAVSSKMLISKLMIDPGSNSILYASTNSGIYKTTDAGGNWTLITPVRNYVDMEFKPSTSGNSLTIYASTKYSTQSVYMSTDAGATWTNIRNLSSANVPRIDLAVTPANPNFLYLIAVNTSSGLQSIMRYDGFVWTNQYFGGFNKALLGHHSDASGPNTGQGKYDLAIAVSPINSDHVFIGGINVHQSTDGGVSWSCSSCWTSGWYNHGSHPVTYADQHMLKFQRNNVLFQCNDGGLFKSVDNGATWTHKTGNMAIGQLYRLGVSKSNHLLTLMGLQDNGTRQVNNGSWRRVYSGDGMETIIDYEDENIQYTSYIHGDIKRTDNNWTGWSPYSITYSGGSWINGIASGEAAAWVTPYVMDPVSHETLYIGLKEVWKSIDKGASWTVQSSFGNTSYPTLIRSLAVAPSNTDYIYAANPTQFWVTTSGGTSWTERTSLPFGVNSITYITVKDSDPSTVWVTCGGYDGNRIFKTTDAGASWTNISAGLPNLPVMSVIQNTLSLVGNELYVATDVGVYMKKGAANWLAWGNNLPNVLVNELEISYVENAPQNSRLRAATGGRGLWETELNTTDEAPVVITTVPSGITASSAQSGGNVVSEGLSSVIERGVVWSTNRNPTISDNKIIHGTTGAGAYISNITGLSPITTYHVRAYAINNEGIDYGQDEVFITSCGVSTLPYSEDFDSGTDVCWNGTSGIASWFNVAPDGWNIPTSTGGGKCFITNGNSIYLGSKTYILSSPTINLTGYKDNIITFDMWMDSDDMNQFDDGGFIECSLDGGNNWEGVNAISGIIISPAYDGSLNIGFGNPYEGELSYNGDHIWKNVTISLPSKYNNISSFKMRYKFGTSNSMNYYGWAIDDVNITGTPTSTTAPVITSLSDNSFFADKGKQITIVGSNLSNATVTIGGVTGTINSNTATQIIVTFSPGRYQNNTLTVTNANGSATSTVTVNTRNDIPVGGGIDFHTTIQSALDGLHDWYGSTSFASTLSGYLQGAKTIEIYAGIYNEGVALNNNINTTSIYQLTIQPHGTDIVTIDAVGKTYGLYTGTVNYVQISKLQIKSAGDNIYIKGSDCEVSYVKLTGATKSGLALIDGDNHSIHHNILAGNSENGIYIDNSNNNNIINNTIADNADPSYNMTFIINESFETAQNGVLPTNWGQWTNAGSYWYTLAPGFAIPDGNQLVMHYAGSGCTDNSSLDLPYITNFNSYAAVYLDFYYDLSGNTSLPGPYDRLEVQASVDYAPFITLATFTNDNISGHNFHYEKIDITSVYQSAGTELDLSLVYISNGANFCSDPSIDKVRVYGVSGAGSNGIYVTNNSSNVNLKNNIISAAGGNNQFFALKSESGSSISSNYNLYYGNGNTHIFSINGTANNTGPMTATDITGDPNFRSSSTGDYHINSEKGVYAGGQWPPVNQTGGTWVNHTSTSPALDAGDPGDVYVNEPASGNRINQGCYGNTVQASKSDISLNWTGNSNSDWDDIANWSGGQVPTFTDDVVIPNNCINYPNIFSMITLAKCRNLLIENNANIAIDMFGSLTVSGTVTNNAGAANFTLIPFNGYRGSLIANNDFPVTAGRSITGDRWYYMFPELQLTPTSLLTQEGTYINNNIFSYNEITEDYWNATTVFGTTGWTSEVGSATLRTDRGYIFNRVGMPNKTYMQTGGNIYTSAKTFNLSYTAHSGTPPSGGYTNTWLGYDGWNLVGNPYTSAVNWNNVPLNGIETGIYFFDGSNYKYYMKGGDGTQGSPYNSSLTLNGGSEFIPAGQGFMVKVDNTGSTHGATLTLPIASKVHALMPYNKNKKTVPNLLKLNIQKGDFTDEMIIRTLPDTYAVTEEHDAKYDAYKLFAFDNSLPQIFSRDDDNTNIYSINALPEIEKLKVVSLGLYIGSEGQYSINSLENNFKGYEVYLYDIKLDENIKFDKGVLYTFESETGTIDNRFEIIFNKVNSTNIDEFDENDVIIYPNPSSDFFNIYIKNQSEKYRIEFSSVTGSLIYKSRMIDNDTYKLDTQHQSSGIYFLKIIFENKRELNRKIIIK